MPSNLVRVPVCSSCINHNHHYYCHYCDSFLLDSDTIAVVAVIYVFRSNLAMPSLTVTTSEPALSTLLAENSPVVEQPDQHDDAAEGEEEDDGDDEGAGSHEPLEQAVPTVTVVAASSPARVPPPKPKAPLPESPVVPRPAVSTAPPAATPAIESSGDTNYDSSDHEGSDEEEIRNLPPPPRVLPTPVPIPQRPPVDAATTVPTSAAGMPTRPIPRPPAKFRTLPPPPRPPGPEQPS